MSDGLLKHSMAQPALGPRAPGAPAGQAPGLADGLGAAAQRVLAPSPAYHTLAQQMQVFLTHTDLQHGRKNKFFLQQTLELLAELDQHNARAVHLQTALQDTQAHIETIKQKLLAMAAESVGAEHEALSIAQARAHLATLLHDKLVQEFK
jgi:hypothetical protein